MAFASTSVAVNMNNWQFYETTNLQVTSTQITETHGFDMRTTLYLGIGFSGDAQIGILSGELHEIYHYLNGVEQWYVTGLMARDAAVVADYLNDDSPAVLNYLFAGNDTFNGSTFADQLNGYNGNDKINGSGGNDKINGGAGSDVINGGAGNDTITWGTGDTVNGGVGKDILKVSAALLDLTTLANNKIVNVETINLAGTTTLRLNLQDLLAFPEDDLKVTGNGADTVDFVGTLGTGTEEGTFTRYSLGGGASLLIHSDIDVV
jgi:Ca2+-binding RTX toxin-like protein